MKNRLTIGSVFFLIAFLLPVCQSDGREISFFGAIGGWEPDSSTIRGWQGELLFGGLNNIDIYLGSSYADKYFFTRSSASLRVYSHYSRTGYLKLGLWKKSYDYPVAITPVPDSNAYKNVPSVEVEIGDDLLSNLRGSLAYEYIHPDFFFDPSTTANNHKISGELIYQTDWRPLRVHFLSSFLRDPDPDSTLVDKVNHRVSVAYTNQTLLGGGLDVSFSPVEGGILLIPNRDLDRSFDYSILTHLSILLNSLMSLRGDEVYDHYSSQSVFSGNTSQISTLAFSWKVTKDLELSTGGKVVIRPILNESGAFFTFRWSLG